MWSAWVAAGRRLFRFRMVSLLAALLPMTLVASVLAGVPALAAPGEDLGRPALQKIPSAAVHPPDPHRTPVSDGTAGKALHGSPAVTWPHGTADVALPAVTPSVAARQAPARAGSLPVRLGRPAASGPAARATEAPSSTVHVEVLDQKSAAKAHRDGLLVRLSPTGGVAPGPVTVQLDYSGFRHAFGADWAGRLRLTALPACALSTPDAPSCQGTPLRTGNDVKAGTLTADTAMAGQPMLLAATAGDSGPSGDFKATSLSPSATWTAGGSNGDFGWSYPLRVPKVPGGLLPTVALSYSSSAVDGRTAATNNQPSWIGQGFDYWPGYIERTYKPCADDQAGGGNNTTKTGDLCWATDNATLSLNGHTTELVRDDATSTWRPRHDDGSRIQRANDPATENGDNDNEYWKVTETDGTQYWFGVNRLPGWATGNAESNSTWTAPVYGNHAGEPCHAATFEASVCTQAWRWNLDYVVDPHGNAISYRYTKETNSYAADNKATSPVGYVRGGTLSEIRYGLRTGHLFDDPPARVEFTVADRCIPGTTCATSAPKNWPDTPWDRGWGLPCTGSTSVSDCNQARTSPTFWSQKRLASVTTQVANGSGYSDVDSWALTQTYPDPGDGTQAGLWLHTISHSGHAGGTATLPDVTLAGTQLANRVNTGASVPAMNWWRLASIVSETGGETTVSYSGVDCSAGNLPPAADSNTHRCYPVRWTPPDNPEMLDWFNRYVVTDVVEADNAGLSAPKHTHYDYVGTPAWRFDDLDGISKDGYKTWSQWRGYGQVNVTTGLAADGQSQVQYRYFRGMDGDKLAAGGTKSVTVADSTGATATDADPLAGTVREQDTINGPGGSVVGRTITDPWVSAPTSTRVRPWATAHAYLTGTATTRGYTALSAGGWRQTSSSNTYNAQGLVTQTDDRGDVSTATDDKCVRTSYARNESSWLITTPAEVETVAVGCDTTPNRPNDLISDTRNLYDGSSTVGAAPTVGNVTATQQVSGWSGGAATYLTTATTTYDDYGRTLTATDALHHITSTSYAPATGLPTSTTVTNPAGQSTTTTMETAFGLPTDTVDANGKHTRETYDPLGRLTGVWLPGRDPSKDLPNLAYAYQLTTSGPNVVTSSTLRANGKQTVSYALYDGMLRPIQTQAPATDAKGGRTLTNTFYDSRGQVVKENAAYANLSVPGTALAIPDDAAVPSQTVTSYDGAGRATAKIFNTDGKEKWRTTTGYGGDHTDVTPPAGGTPTTTYTDARGNTTQLRQYHGATPTGAYDATSYTYTPAGKPASLTDPAGNVWSYGYDLLGRKIKSVNPDKGTSTSGYDDGGETISTTDARGVTLAYAYDTLGRKTAEYQGSTDGTKLAAWTYDTVAKGQPTSSTRYLNGNAYTSTVTGYDDGYRPTGSTVTIPSSEGGLAGTYTIGKTYNIDGTEATTTEPAVGGLPAETLNEGYDQFGEPNTLTATQPGGTTSYVQRSYYTALGDLNELVLDGAKGQSVWLVYDHELDTRRLSEVYSKREKTGAVQGDVTYGYDPAGNVTRISDQPDTANTGVPADTQCFGYDYLQRLTQAWTPSDATSANDCATAPTDESKVGGPAPYWHQYGYDLTGNRTTRTVHTATTTATTTTTFPAPGATRPHTATADTTSTTGLGGVQSTSATSYGYDADGNTTGRTVDGTAQTLTWDAEGHLASDSQPGAAGSTLTDSTVYDADGAQLITHNTTGATLYLGDTELRLDKASGALTGTRYYNHAGHTIAVRVGPSTLTWLSNNGQGSPQLAFTAGALDVTRQYNDPFGKPRGPQPTTWPGDHTFIGGTHNLTNTDPNANLVHLGARDYDPTTGRFLSADPLLDPTNPQQLNGYAYANNNPTTFTDPSGARLACGGEGGQDSSPCPQSGRSGCDACGGAISTGGCTACGSYDGWDVGWDDGNYSLNGIDLPAGANPFAVILHSRLRDFKKQAAQLQGMHTDPLVTISLIISGCTVGEDDVVAAMAHCNDNNYTSGLMRLSSQIKAVEEAQDDSEAKWWAGISLAMAAVPAIVGKLGNDEGGREIGGRGGQKFPGEEEPPDIALGLQKVGDNGSALDEFAMERDALTYKEWPGRGSWNNKFLGYLDDGSEARIHFNLDGIENPVSSAQSGRDVDPTGYDHLTNWELYQVSQNPQSWSRITWYRNGEVVGNPFR